MKSSEQITHWDALDWVRNHHQGVIVDQAGAVVAEFAFEHSAAGCRKREGSELGS
jgi:hypothetical protein